MKELTILSGKGGAGKTSVTAAIASFAKNTIFCDNDVDAADLHLIFNPNIIEQHRFSSGNIAFINSEKCSNCGICEGHCRFDAIHRNEFDLLEINPLQCEGCRLCERTCPETAISSTESFNNKWFVSQTRFGTLVHAEMGPGEENSGKLVTRIREKAYDLASEIGAEFIINDGPPGIGCSAIASITGTDLVVLVIEPTISGLHDAKRLITLVSSFGISISAIINKFDINPAFTKIVEQYLKENKIPIVGRLSFSTKVVESMVQNKSIVEYAPDTLISKEIYSIWEKIIHN